MVAGEALIDLVVTADQILAVPGGAPYNVARGCARLGIETGLMATMSSDGFGELLAAGLAESDVSTALVQRTDRPTTLAVAEIGADGAATYRFYLDGTSATLLAPVALPTEAAAFVTGGLGLVLEPMATADRARRRPERAAMSWWSSTSIAGPWRSAIARRMWPGSIASSPEPTSSRRATRTSPGCRRTASELREQRPAGRPRDRRGRRHDDSDAERVRRWSPSIAVPVVDTIGAGDAFTAGFISWWVASGRHRAGARRPPRGRARRARRSRGGRRGRRPARRRPATPRAAVSRLALRAGRG